MFSVKKLEKCVLCISILQRLTDKYTLVQKAGSKAGKKDLRHAPSNEVSVRQKSIQR